jgi:hypothetical protein
MSSSDQTIDSIINEHITDDSEWTENEIMQIKTCSTNLKNFINLYKNYISFTMDLTNKKTVFAVLCNLECIPSYVGHRNDIDLAVMILAERCIDFYLDSIVDDPESVLDSKDFIKSYFNDYEIRQVLNIDPSKTIKVRIDGNYKIRDKDFLYNVDS